MRVQGASPWARTYLPRVRRDFCKLVEGFVGSFVNHFLVNIQTAQNTPPPCFPGEYALEHTTTRGAARPNGARRRRVSFVLPHS